MKVHLPAACCLFFVWGGALHAQTPTITSVQNESGSDSLCPGGIAFIRGTNLGGSSTVVTVGTKQAYVLNTVSGTSLQIELPVDAPLGATTIKAGNSATFNITLVQYCPGMPTSPPPAGLATAFHYSSQKQVTSGFPATPNEQIGVLATGLGPTNPVFATGTAPNDTNAKLLSKPTVTIAGRTATVTDAYLTPNSPGFYNVVFTVPANIPTLDAAITVSIGGLTSNNTVLPISTGAIIASVANAASFIDSALPNGNIAQGAIVYLKGINLGPGTLAVSPNPFQDTTLSGTSVNITVNGTTTAGLMYYTSATQVAFLLPSNTPAGLGTIQATYNGQAGPSTSIRVFSSAPGIITTTSDGQGAGIVTYPDYSLVSTTKAANCGGVYTTCGAANPGDTLIIWATGLGPVSGSDAAGSGLGVNMSSLPLTVRLGNVPVTPSYQGRSGCCIGEDQIVFTVPANAPLGCNVPLSLQVNNFISNVVAIPVAASGSRTCTPADPTFSTALIPLLTSGSGPFTYGELDLRHRQNGSGFQDLLDGTLIRFTIAAALQPFFFSWIDEPALGTCSVANDNNGAIPRRNPPLTVIGSVDVGSQVTVSGPNGAKTGTISDGAPFISLSDTGNYLVPGTYTISVPGGKDAPAFSSSVVVPALPVLTTPQPNAANPISVTRSNGLTVTWSGGQLGSYIELEISSAIDQNTGAEAVCWVAAESASFTVPPNVLLALPAGNSGELTFRAFLNPANLSGSGLTATKLATRVIYFVDLTFR